MTTDTPLADQLFRTVNKDVEPEKASAQQWQTVARIARALATDSIRNGNITRAKNWQDTAHQAQQRLIARMMEIGTEGGIEMPGQPATSAQ